jgi:autotransporter passenger strand-loop-strand repeat protein
VLSGGLASSSTIDSGGTQIISSGGTALGIVRVAGGGRQIVSGLAELVIVSAGGEQDVSRGGTAEAGALSGGTGKVFPRSISDFKMYSPLGQLS